MMNETTERFFQEIADRIGYSRVEEVHLFPAVKQGSVESGLAVVAAAPESETAEGVARHVVYTARYRHTLKGGDRGKWEANVHAEGDAPLITVDEVVRGVVRRSGDAFHPERIAGDQFRAIVPAPPAPMSEPASTEQPDTQQPDTAPV